MYASFCVTFSYSVLVTDYEPEVQESGILAPNLLVVVLELT